MNPQERERRKRHRKAVEDRDNGVCRNCGLDTVWLDRIMRHARSHLRDLSGWDERFMALALLAMGFKADRPLWEADHIDGLAEGGEDDSDNCQTLCIPCHTEKTGMASTSRAKGRRIFDKRPRTKPVNRPDKLARLANKKPRVMMPC